MVYFPTVSMKSVLLKSGLSKRTQRCLTVAGFPIEKEAIIHALQAGELYPHYWPPTYGKYTHIEVCRWAGVDPTTVPYTRIDHGSFDLNNGLSYRANNCVRAAGIVATKEAVTQALNTGKLWPRKRPVGYGKVTHAEICRWVGVDPQALHKSRLRATPAG